MFFDRYKTDIRRVYTSFSERDPLYCDPINYCTTYEECAEYAHKIDIAQNQFKEWEERYDNRTKLIKIVVIVLSLILYLALIVYIYDLINDKGFYALLKSIFAIASGCFFCFLYNAFHGIFHKRIEASWKREERVFFPRTEQVYRKII